MLPSFKHGDEYLVLMNDGRPCLSSASAPTYSQDVEQSEWWRGKKDVKSYVKERYKSAVQLIKKHRAAAADDPESLFTPSLDGSMSFLTWASTCSRPMMIKEVAEEIWRASLHG